MRRDRSLFLVITLTLFILAPSAWLYGASSATQQQEKSGLIESTTQFVKKVLHLKPVSKEKEKTPSQSGPLWLWSPRQGQFVSQATGQANQKTAEELYQHALELRKAGEKESKVIKELKTVVHDFSDSAYAPEAQFLIASIFEENGKLIRAAGEYQKFIKDFPRSERINEATDHLFKMGVQFLSTEKQKVMGVGIIPTVSKAADLFRFIVEQAPYGPYGDQAQLQLGIAYRKLGRFEESIKAFETLIENYPTSSLIDEAHYQLAETSYGYSQSAIRDQRVSQQASTHLKDFIKQHAASSLAERARLLKQQLDEQDAEKNYRIGLYYEKQGYADSALVYYEDVANRYAGTPYGKKAAERLKTLEEPVRAMQKGEEATEKRLAEVRALLEALKQETAKADKSGRERIAKQRTQLETELDSLLGVQKQFKHESREQYTSRKKAYHERVRNLREKFKTFNHKKKLLKDIDSPELLEVFKRWEDSLLKEQAELSEERKILKSLGLELRETRIPWSGWIPFFGKSKEVSPDDLIEYEGKKWVKLEEAKARLRENRKQYELELEEMVRGLEELDRKELEMVQATPKFQELLPANLKHEKIALDEKRKKLDQDISSFEQAKKDYASHYGTEFLKTLTLGDVRRFKSVQALLMSGADLNDELMKLQAQKASLSEAWLVQKERLQTLVKAAEGVQGKTVQTPQEAIMTPTINPEEQAKQARLLKKRIKFVEREIRSRLDQIQDWQRENAGRMEQLAKLLQPEEKSLSLGEKTGKVLAPASSVYKLTKAFIFGLPNRDRELVTEAKARLEGEGEPIPPDRLKAIRELEEEIELQSILIQGRAEEVVEFERRLANLQEQAKQVPGFEYQSLLIQRFPSTLQYSLTSAQKLLGEGKQETIFVDRVNRATEELAKLEQSLFEVSNQIEVVGQAISRAKKPEAPKPSILPSILGDTETLPTTSEVKEEAAPSVPSDEQLEFEARLTQTWEEILKKEEQFSQSGVSYEKALHAWYAGEVQNQIRSTFSPEGKALVAQKEAMGIKQLEIQNSIRKFLQEEYNIAESQRKFLEKKLSELEKRLSKLSLRTPTLSDALSHEINLTRQLRDSIVGEVSFLESSLKSTQP